LASADVSNWPPDLSSSLFPPSVAAASDKNPSAIMADCLNCFLRRWYRLESFDTLFELNSVPLAATVTSNNCATTITKNV
jgi:hypothetical protein